MIFKKKRKKDSSHHASSPDGSHLSPAPPSRPAPAPPETQPPAPDQEPAKKPDRKPGRPSPRPGRKPAPVTDPKNYLDRLREEYFHTLPADIKSNIAPAIPIREIQDLAAFATEVLKDRDSTRERWLEIPHRLKPEEVPDRLRSVQQGYEPGIQEKIEHYLQEIFGPLYFQHRENIDLSWKKPYEAAREPGEAAKQTPADSNDHPGSPPAGELSEYERYDAMPEMSDEDLDFLLDSLHRSELYYQLVQGFGILYMDGFFRMMRKDLEEVAGKELPDLYEQYHLNGHNTHHRTFFDVLQGRNLPRDIDETMEKNQSEGRVWATTEPSTDEQTGNVNKMRSVAHAASDIGVVLAHEALKGFFQMLTPWARLNENYMNERELNLTRMSLNSFWAEIRQFSMGPAFVILFQQFLDALEIPSHPSREEFYLAVQNLLLLPLPRLQQATRWIMEPESFSQEDQAIKSRVRRSLLSPLDDPEEIDWQGQ